MTAPTPAFAADLRPTRALARPRRPLAPLAISAGGLLLALGAWLPWLTLFAGLQTVSGLAGPNGRAVLGAGVTAALLGALALRRPSPRLLGACAALGAVLVGFVAWLIVGLLGLARAHAADPMALTRVGPGLFVALAGALLVAAASIAARRERAAA
jgi:hypothetical protein